MTLAEQGHRLRSEILRLQVGQARRYEPKLKRRILAWVERARRDGMSERECSKRLGIPQRRFSIWRSHQHAHPPTKLVEVEVEHEEPVAPITFAIASPSGYRIDGLTLEQAIAFMRALA